MVTSLSKQKSSWHFCADFSEAKHLCFVETLVPLSAQMLLLSCKTCAAK